MTRLLGKIVAAAAMTAVAITSANAACWTPDSVSAAKMRDFEAMLRTASSRCVKEVPELKVAYSQFVTLSRPAFATANKTVRAHFAADLGQVASFAAYNSFLATIEKSYGTGAPGLACTDFGAFVSAANAEGATSEVIARLADEAGASPTLVGQRCSNRVAAPRVTGLQQVAVNK